MLLTREKLLHSISGVAYDHKGVTVLRTADNHAVKCNPAPEEISFHLRAQEACPELVLPLLAHGQNVLVTPWASHGNLAQYLRSNPRNKKHLPAIVLQVLVALDKLPFPHGDLHLGNVLIHGQTKSRPRAWLSDFGRTGRPKNTKLRDRVLLSTCLHKFFPKSKRLRELSVWLADETKDPLRAPFFKHVLQ